MPQAPATITTEMVDRTSRVMRKVNAAQARAKINEITCQAVGSFLNRGARSLRLLDGFDNLSEARIPPEPLGPNLKSAGLINGAGEDLAARHLLHRHRLAGNWRLVHECPAAYDGAVDRDAFTGLDEDELAESELGCRILWYSSHCDERVAVSGGDRADC